MFKQQEKTRKETKRKNKQQYNKIKLKLKKKKQAQEKRVCAALQYLNAQERKEKKKGRKTTTTGTLIKSKTEVWKIARDLSRRKNTCMIWQKMVLPLIDPGPANTCYTSSWYYTVIISDAHNS